MKFIDLLTQKLLEFALPLSEMPEMKQALFDGVELPNVVLAGEEGLALFTTLTGYNVTTLQPTAVVRFHYNTPSPAKQLELFDRESEVQLSNRDSTHFKNLQLVWLPEIHTLRLSHDKGPCAAQTRACILPYLKDPNCLVVLAQPSENHRFYSPTAELLHSLERADVITVCQELPPGPTRCLQFEKCIVSLSNSPERIAKELLAKAKFSRDFLNRFQTLLQSLPPAMEPHATVKNRILCFIPEIALRAQMNKVQKEEVADFIAFMQTSLEECFKRLPAAYADCIREIKEMLFTKDVFVSFHANWAIIANHRQCLQAAHAKQQESRGFLTEAEVHNREISFPCNPVQIHIDQPEIGVPTRQNLLVCAQNTFLHAWTTLLETYALWWNNDCAVIEARRSVLQSLFQKMCLFQ